MRNRISSRSLILSFLVHLFYKKVGLDPYSNQFTGSFQRSTHNKSLIDGAQCSKFWFVIHGMTDFKQRNDFIFNAFSSGFHFVMKALKIALWKNQWRSGSSGQWKTSGPPGWPGSHISRDLCFSANISPWVLKLTWAKNLTVRPNHERRDVSTELDCSILISPKTTGFYRAGPDDGIL